MGFRYATDARAFCFAIDARDVRAVAVAVDLAPQGVIIAFISAMDLVPLSVNFRARKDTTLFPLARFTVRGLIGSYGFTVKPSGQADARCGYL